LIFDAQYSGTTGAINCRPIYSSTKVVAVGMARNLSMGIGLPETLLIP
jgi:hypothetical protein